MKRSCAVLGLLVLASSALGGGGEGMRQAVWAPDTFGGYASTHILVRYAPGVAPQTAVDGRVVTGIAEIDALHAAWGVTAAAPVFTPPPADRVRAAQLGLERTYRVLVPQGTNTPALVAEYTAAPGVEFAELDGIGGVANTPNDPYYSWLYNMNNTGQTGGTPDADVDAPEAWDLHTGLDTVTLAIIDTGIDGGHEDLAAKLVPGWNVYNNSSDTTDRFGHGTHCAGIGGAIGNNGKGVVGLSWGVKLMPIKCLSDGGSGSESNCAAAIIYGADHGANVESMSLQFYNGSSTLRDAVNYAFGKGVILIAANGNNQGGRVAYPAKFPNCMAISATDHRDTLAWFSNYGAETDVCAAGDSIYSTQRYNTYEHLSGTSMATPLVAGLASLVWTYNGALTNTELEQLIKSCVDDLGATGWDQYYGWGRINARRALELAGPQLVPGDMNCDGVVDFGDVNPFVLALTDPAQWQAIYSGCDLLNGDVNGDGVFDFGDINPFVNLLSGR